MEYEAVIGLEVHVQLSTKSKCFCASSARMPGVSVSDVPVNSQICPVCTGQPGTLPVLNLEVLRCAVQLGVALHCKIREKSIFARKHYFYPDMPKGYQISQYESPICEHGYLKFQIASRAEQKNIGITRIHIEEDAGKSSHLDGFTLVNLNRAGVPLLEVVSEPELRSAEEAGGYLRELHAIVTAINICDGNLEEGNFRCDANVSIRPVGSPALGTRTEIKNLNSFRFVEKAIEVEVARQIELVNSGRKIIQETRGFDSEKGLTYLMRSKEDAQDYRYFPDPDLLPLRVSAAQIDQWSKDLPELPSQMRERFFRAYAFSDEQMNGLIENHSMAGLFDRSMELLKTLDSGSASLRDLARTCLNLIVQEIGKVTQDRRSASVVIEFPAQDLAEIVIEISKGTISASAAKSVVQCLMQNHALDCATRDRSPSTKTVAEVIQMLGLTQVSDEATILVEVDLILSEFPNQVAEIRAGKDKVLGFLVGQLMKRTGGKVNPAKAQELMKKRLS